MVKRWAIKIMPLLAFFAGGYLLGNRLPIPSYNINFAWLYWSQVGDESSLGIKPDGRLIFGPRCDGATEAKKFFSMLRQLKYQRDHGDDFEAYCRDARYRMPPDGIIPLQTGPANPPLHATERHL